MRHLLDYGLRLGLQSGRKKELGKSDPSERLLPVLPDGVRPFLERLQEAWATELSDSCKCTLRDLGAKFALAVALQRWIRTIESRC